MSDYNRDNNRAVWFDVPVVDLGRAASFYADVLGCKVETMSFNDVDFGLIEHADGNGGCLVIEPDWIAAEGGLLLYFNTHGRIHDAVQKATAHGGKILQDIHAIGPHGFRAIVQDSEGNRIALHSEVDA